MALSKNFLKANHLDGFICLVGNFVPWNKESFDQNEDVTFLFMFTSSLQIHPEK